MLDVFPLSFDFLVPQCRALRRTVFFIPLPLNFWPLPPAPATCVLHSRPVRQWVCPLPPAPAKHFIYAHTIIEMHWFCVFSRPAGENTSFYRLLIKIFMDNWETSPNVILALLCLCAVKTFFELPFHIIYWHPVARQLPDPAVVFFSHPLAKFTPPAPAGPNPNAALSHSAYTPSRFSPLTSFPHTGDLNDTGRSNSSVPPLAMTTLWGDWTCAQLFFFSINQFADHVCAQPKILIRNGSRINDDPLHH